MASILNVTPLRAKSIIYRYTGVFLAHQEELDYINSEAYWTKFVEILDDYSDNTEPRHIHDILVGMWQVNHKFYRPMSFISHKEPQWFFSIVGWFINLYTVIKQGI